MEQRLSRRSRRKGFRETWGEWVWVGVEAVLTLWVLALPFQVLVAVSTYHAIVLPEIGWVVRTLFVVLWLGISLGGPLWRNRWELWDEGRPWKRPPGGKGVEPKSDVESA